MTQPTSRSIIKAIACSKPIVSEHWSKWKHNGTIVDQCKQRGALCHVGLAKDRGGHLVNQPLVKRKYLKVNCFLWQFVTEIFSRVIHTKNIQISEIIFKLQPDFLTGLQTLLTRSNVCVTEQRVRCHGLNLRKLVSLRHCCSRYAYIYKIFGRTQQNAANACLHCKIVAKSYVRCILKIYSSEQNKTIVKTVIQTDTLPINVWTAERGEETNLIILDIISIKLIM